MTLRELVELLHGPDWPDDQFAEDLAQVQAAQLPANGLTESSAARSPGSGP